MGSLTQDEAATLIAAAWRGHAARKIIAAERAEEEAFINMRFESSAGPILIERAKVIEQKRREWRVENENKYQNAKVEIKEKVHLYEGPLMSEEMQNTIRNFIIKEKEEKGNFPDIPEEEDGGSKFIFFPDEDGEEGKAADDGKGKKEKGKKEKGKKEKGNGKKKGGDDAADEGWKVAESSFVVNLKDACKDY